MELQEYGKKLEKLTASPFTVKDSVIFFADASKVKLQFFLHLRFSDFFCRRFKSKTSVFPAFNDRNQSQIPSMVLFNLGDNIRRDQSEINEIVLVVASFETYTEHLHRLERYEMIKCKASDKVS